MATPTSTTPSTTPSTTTAGSGPASGAAAPAAPVVRSAADRRMRRLLRLPHDAPPKSIFAAHGVVRRSILIAALRCTVIYLVVPIAGPLIGLRSGIGPWIGLALSAVTVVAVVAATRRFFGADHRWRWNYASLALVILCFVAVQVVLDVRALVT